MLAEQYRNRFLDTIAFVRRVFPYGFRKSPNGNSTPRARFEAIAIGSYHAVQRRPEIRDLPTDLINVNTWLDSDDFIEVTGSDGANAIARLRGRIGFVEDKLVNV